MNLRWKYVKVTNQKSMKVALREDLNFLKCSMLNVQVIYRSLHSFYFITFWLSICRKLIRFYFFWSRLISLSIWWERSIFLNVLPIFKQTWGSFHTFCCPGCAELEGCAGDTRVHLERSWCVHMQAGLIGRGHGRIRS